MGLFEDFAGELLNVAVNYATLGTVGYDKKTGRIDKGLITRTIDESLGEITGRNQMRESIYQANKRADQEDANREQMRKDDLKNKEKQDIAASKQVAAVRAGSQRRRPYLSDSANPEKDFLGL